MTNTKYYLVLVRNDTNTKNIREKEKVFRLDLLVTHNLWVGQGGASKKWSTFLFWIGFVDLKFKI